MKRLYVLLIIFLPIQLFSQVEVKVGLYPKGSFLYNSKFSSNPGKELVLFFTPGIHLGYKNTYFIAKYSYRFGWSDFEKVQNNESFHLSLRQYLIRGIDKFKWSQRVGLFVEAEWALQKWRFNEWQRVSLDKFSQYGLAPFLGFDVSMTRHLKFEVAYGYRFFKEYSHPDLFFAFLYQF